MEGRSSLELVDGKPKVAWEPKTNRWTGVVIQGVLKGAATLDGEWKVVEEATEARPEGSPHLAVMRDACLCRCQDGGVFSQRAARIVRLSFSGGGPGSSSRTCTR